MSPKVIVAVILITLGIVVLAYAGISFTTPGKPINFLGIVELETTDNHFIPPVAGALMLVGGVVLLLVKSGRGA